jgi:hypothetical protein
MRHDPAALLLFRPVNQAELDHIAAADWLTFPPHLPEQPIFYPVLNQDYAAQLARDWNTPHDGVGYLVRFALDADYAAQLPVQVDGDACRGAGRIQPPHPGPHRGGGRFRGRVR